MTSPIKQNEVRLAALRTLNHLTRLVLDMDDLHASRDVKNIDRAQERLARDLAVMKNLYDQP